MSQYEQIKNHLNDGRSITSLEALEQYGCFRLAARVKELRDAGMKIISEPFKTDSGKIVSRYLKVK